MTKNNKIRFLNIYLDNITEQELLGKLTSGILFTPNVDHIVRLQEDEKFFEIYNKADWKICDSRILKILSRIRGNEIKEVIPGSSFFTSYYNFHKENENERIFLLGAAEGVAQLAMDKINHKIGRKIIVGAYSPYYGFENDDKENAKIFSLVEESKASTLLVGLGSPKQEFWIMNNHKKFNSVKLFMALGATIDFEAGTLQRAPKTFQKLNLEWLFRLISEPKRLWKRYLIDDIKIFYYLFLDLIKEK